MLTTPHSPQRCIMDASQLPPSCSAAVSAESCAGQTPSEDLRTLAIQSLEAHPAFRGRLAKCGIQIESAGSTLVLNGRVPSWYLKQLLQETVRRVDGVRSVENNVAVVNPSDLLCTGS